MSRVKEIIHPLPPDKGFLRTWNKYFLTEIRRNMQAFAFQALRECSSWTSRNVAVQMDFFAFFCQGFFLGNWLLCHSPKHPKLWPRHYQNLVGDPGLYCKISYLFW